VAIKVPILSEWNPKGVKRAMQDFKKLETNTQKAGFALKKALVPATAALAGLTAAAGSSLKAAAADAAQQQELARQLEASTGATEAQIAANEKFIATMELATATSDAVLRPALGNLVRATGDVTAAQELLGTALDVSAATGKDLNTVSEALSKAYQGQTDSLKRLDPSLTAVIASGAEFDEIGQALADTFGGAASEAADTTAGRFERMKIQMENARETIGYALLPILDALVPVLESVAGWIGENTDLFITIAAVVGTFSAAIIAANTAMKVWNTVTTVTKALNYALSTSFTTLQVASGLVIFTALVGVFILLQKRFKIIQKLADALSRVFNLLRAAVEWFVNTIIDGINAMIDLANKIPFVEIDKITWKMGDAADAADDMGESAKEAANKMAGFADAELAIASAASEAAYQQQLANLEYQTAADHMAELFPTQEAMADAIQTTTDAMKKHNDAQQLLSDWNTDLIEEFDLLFGRFDNEKAVNDFRDAINEAAGAMEEFGKYSREANEANSELFQALANVINTLDNIPATKQLDLILQLERGEFDAVITDVTRFLAMAQQAQAILTGADITALAGMLGGNTMAPAPVAPLPTSSTVIGAGYENVSGFLGGATVNVYMPAGSDGAEVARSLQRHAKRSGTLPIPTTTSIRS
jgi:phage-related protein